MHTNEPRQLEGVELGYDPRDIDAKRIYKSAIWFFVLTVFFFGLGAIIWIRYGLAHTSDFDKRKPAIVGPLVQGNMAAKVDIMNVRQDEHRRMTTYGTNPDGKQRIPVDQAIALIAQRGLPVVPSEGPAKSPGNTIKQNAVEPGTTPPVTATPETTPDASAPTTTTP